MSDPKQARMLLEAAEEDMNLLHAVVGRPELTDRIFGYGVQQVAEKCMKAWLCICGSNYPLSHDLALLMKTLVMAPNLTVRKRLEVL